MESLLTIYKQLNDLGFALDQFRQEDEEQLYHIFRSVVDTGSQFPYECNSLEEFHRQFLNSQFKVYVCHSSNNEVVGGFYLKSNFPGRSSHLANAAYMIHESYRGKGIGTLLVKASLQIARDLGFHAMQFNMVLSQNVSAIRLYQKLGFDIVGTLPKAVRNPDQSYQDGYIMYRKFEDL
jgi:L-amino acid N-acyltransferase YncA